MPIGVSVDAGDRWRIGVAAVVPGGTAAVLARNRFNRPPAPGAQYFLMRLVVTRPGPTHKRQVNGPVAGAQRHTGAL